MSLPLRKYAKKFGTFVLLTSVVLVCCFAISKAILNKLYEQEAVLPKEVTWLALGDSHITNSINPNNYEYLANRSHSGERLLYNFEKLKFYVERNPQLEVVILGYWYNSPFYDIDWVLNAKDAVYRYESYLPLMLINNSEIDYLNVPEKEWLFKENYYGFKYGVPAPATRLAVKNYLTLNRELEMKGGFRKARTVYTPDTTTVAKDTTKMELPPLAVSHLESIVKYLKEKKIKLVLYNTPATAEFFRPLSNRNIALTDSLAHSHLDNENVWYIDYSRYQLEDKYFNDRHHLNYDGANLMTPILLDSIKSLVSKDLR